MIRFYWGGFTGNCFYRPLPYSACEVGGFWSFGPWRHFLLEPHADRNSGGYQIVFGLAARGYAQLMTGTPITGRSKEPFIKTQKASHPLLDSHVLGRIFHCLLPPEEKEVAATKRTSVRLQEPVKCSFDGIPHTNNP